MQRKRFIAGASCPKCKQLDKVYTYEQDGREFAACTQCDYLEPRPTPEQIEEMHRQQDAAQAEPEHPVRWQTDSE